MSKPRKKPRPSPAILHPSLRVPLGEENMLGLGKADFLFAALPEADSSSIGSEVEIITGGRGVSGRSCGKSWALRSSASGSTTCAERYGHFIAPAELQTDLGKQRLAACLFRLLHKGDIFSMCQMNAAGQRDTFYQEIIEGGA